jgi:hypothetical protein
MLTVRVGDAAWMAPPAVAPVPDEYETTLTTGVGVGDDVGFAVVGCAVGVGVKFGADRAVALGGVVVGAAVVGAFVVGMGVDGGVVVGAEDWTIIPDCATSAILSPQKSVAVES